MLSVWKLPIRDMHGKTIICISFLEEEPNHLKKKSDAIFSRKKVFQLVQIWHFLILYISCPLDGSVLDGAYQLMPVLLCLCPMLNMTLFYSWNITETWPVLCSYTDSIRINRPGYSIGMYWTIFWQPSVRVQQNIFEKTLIESLLAHFALKFVNYSRYSESLKNVWKSTNRCDRRKMTSISEFFIMFKDSLCRDQQIIFLHKRCQKERKDVDCKRL